MVPPGNVDPATMAGDMPTTQAKAVLYSLNAALVSNDVEKLASCFYEEQAFWRDIVSLTSHLRTFVMPNIVAAALLHMKSLRGIEGDVEVVRDAKFVVMSPVMVSVYGHSSARYKSDTCSYLEDVH
jgi:hypothetical protein